MPRGPEDKEHPKLPGIPRNPGRSGRQGRRPADDIAMKKKDKKRSVGEAINEVVEKRGEMADKLRPVRDVLMVFEKDTAKTAKLKQEIIYIVVKLDEIIQDIEFGQYCDL